MQPRDPKPTGASRRNALPGSEFLASSAGGAMDTPSSPAADTFAEEMALGTESPSSSRTDRVREDLAAARPDAGSTGSSSASGLTDKVSSATEAVTDKVSSATEAVTDKAPAAVGRVKEWVTAHPLVAVGAGVIGGIVLGASGSGGSQHHHHYYGDSGTQDQSSSADRSSSQAQQGDRPASHAQQGGGILGLIQQTGLLETVTQSAERFMRMANDQASDLARQHVPGFEDQLRQKRGPSATTPVTPSPQHRVTGATDRRS